MNLDYNTFAEEIAALIENTQTMALATCSRDKVTARSMAVVNDGLTLLFQTSGLSEKARQLTENSNVAFAAGNMQVEALAYITSDPDEMRTFIDKFKVKYPQYYAAYSGMPDEVTVVCKPIRFALYKFVDGKPCTDILDVCNGLAYREVLK